MIPQALFVWLSDMFEFQLMTPSAQPDGFRPLVDFPNRVMLVSSYLLEI